MFGCLTEAGHLSAFWGPAGTTTPLDGIIVEPRPGGRFETLIVNSADSSTHHMRAVFDEVDAPHTLSWTEYDSGLSTTVTFTDAGADRTEIRLHQRRVPEAMRGPDEQNGFQTSLDRRRLLLGLLGQPCRTGEHAFRSHVDLGYLNAVVGEQDFSDLVAVSHAPGLATL